MPVRPLNCYEANIRARIRAHLTSPGVSYATLAAALHVTTSAVGMWVCARSSPRLAALVALAAHLNTSLHSLVHETIPMSTPKVKKPTVALTGRVRPAHAPKRPLSRLALHVSPASDVAQGRPYCPPVAAAPSTVGRPYSEAVRAVGGLVTRRLYDYK